MRRRPRVALGALAVALVVTPPVAAQGPAATPSGEGFPRTAVDDLGNELRLPRPPRRIVSVAPSNTEIVFALGLGDRLVGVSDFADHPERAARLPSVGGYANVDVERIVALEPDLVLASGFQVNSAVHALRRLGLAVYVVEPEGVAGVLDGIRRLAVATGVPRAGERLADELSRRVAAVRAAVATAPRRRVYYELSAELFTVGPGSFIDDMIRLAGGHNIAGDADRPYPRISSEVVVARDPEVIVLGNHLAGVDREALLRRPGWASITAVVEDRIVPVPDVDVLNRPGPRFVEGLEMLARGIHPERFTEPDR